LSPIGLLLRGQDGTTGESIRLPDEPMAKPKPEKKPPAAAAHRVLPTELQLGERLVGETMEPETETPS